MFSDVQYLTSCDIVNILGDRLFSAIDAEDVSPASAAMHAKTLI